MHEMFNACCGVFIRKVFMHWYTYIVHMEKYNDMMKKDVNRLEDEQDKEVYSHDKRLKNVADKVLWSRLILFFYCLVFVLMVVSFS